MVVVALTDTTVWIVLGLLLRIRLGLLHRFVLYWRIVKFVFNCIDQG